MRLLLSRLSRPLPLLDEEDDDAAAVAAAAGGAADDDGPANGDAVTSFVVLDDGAVTDAVGLAVADAVGVVTVVLGSLTMILPLSYGRPGYAASYYY